MFRHLSIQKKIAIISGAFTILLMLVFCVVQSAALERMLTSFLKSSLQSDVESCQDLITYEQNTLEIDDRISEFEDVNIFVFDEEYALLYGRSFGEALSDAFYDGGLQKVDYGNKEWYLYDAKYEIEGFGTVWIRGANSIGTIRQTGRIYHLIAIVSMGILSVLMFFGVYRIIRYCFRPMLQIVDTANRINDNDDLSERIRLEGPDDEFKYMAESFDKMLDRIEASFEQEKRFTSDASHELRTPISVILSASEYALQQDDTEEYRASMQAIHTQARHMSALVSQLLEIARMEQGKQPLYKETFCLSDVLEAVCEQMEPQAKERGISIQRDISKDILFTGDQTLMMRMTVNLVSNAIRYGKDGGYVKVCLRETEQELDLRVYDNGIGIDAQQQQKIWDRFYQADTARTTGRQAGGGYGLGLYMVRWIAQAHHGRAEVESTPGEGSCFQILLPKCREQQQNA